MKSAAKAGAPALLLALAGAALFTSLAAHAAKPSEAQLRYQQERAACLNGESNQDRATCLKEAAAALQEAKRGNLSTGDLRANSEARCDAQPVADRQDCLMRMRGAGSTSGTAREGGIVRELSRPVAPK